eukprot:766867-Pelagomonas_calceolata.AAC.1
MFEVGQDLLLSAQSWDMPALGRLLHAGLAEQEPLRTRAGQKAAAQPFPMPTTAAATAAAAAAG